MKNQTQKNAATHDSIKNHWAADKKRDSKWLSKKGYEKKTGHPGRS